MTERFGGKVQVVPGYEHVVHLMRGEVYDIPIDGDETVHCLVMGGAESIDKMWRVEGVSWWAAEMPSEAEYANCTANLERVGWSVDYVFTHEVPYNAKVDAMNWSYAVKRRDPPWYELSGYLQWVDDKLDKGRLRMWYAGHHHVDRMVLDEQHRVLYQDVVLVE